MTDQPDGVLRGGRAEHPRGVDDLLDGALEHPQFAGQAQRDQEKAMTASTLTLPPATPLVA